MLIHTIYSSTKQIIEMLYLLLNRYEDIIHKLKIDFFFKFRMCINMNFCQHELIVFFIQIFPLKLQSLYLTYT